MATKTNNWILLSIGLLAWFGVIVRFGLSIDKALLDGGSVGEVFIKLLGYLTILANIMVAIVATVVSLWPSSRLGRFCGSQVVFGGTVVAIVFVSLGYYFLLSSAYMPIGLGGALNTINHYITPTAMLVYWLVFMPREKMPIFLPCQWSVYFLAYELYIAIRGEVISQYPYPFVNVVDIGYLDAILNGVMLLAAYVIIAYVLYTLALIRLKFFRIGQSS